MGYDLIVGSITSAGSQYQMAVEPDGSINVNASLAVGSASVIVGGSIQTYNPIGIGSSFITNPNLVGSLSTQGIVGSVAVTTNPVAVSGGVIVRAGSIQTYSPVGVGSVVLSGTGIVLGSVAITNVLTGSINIATSPLPISGIVNINAGSIRIMGVSGGTSMPLLVTSGTEARLNVDINSQPAWTGTGSTVSSGITSVTGSVLLYNYAAFTGVGSVVISGTPITIGSFAITTTPLPVSGNNLAGSFSIITNPLPVSGGVIVRAGSIQTYSPLGVGSVVLSGVGIVLGSVALTTGSVNIYGDISASSPSVVKENAASPGSLDYIGAQYNGSVFGARLDLGSYLMIAGSISSMPSISATNPSTYAISGIIANTGSIQLAGAHYNGSAWALRMTAGSNLLVDIGNIGSVAITTSPVPVSGGIIVRAGSIQTYSPLGVGSVLISGTAIVSPVVGVGSTLLISTAGSVGIYNAEVLSYPIEGYRGAFGFSGITATGSWTGSSILTPGAGSKLFLKGFTASADVATKFKLSFSGGTPTYLGTWAVPNSGTVAINFLGMEPSGATNQPIAVGMFNAGTLALTVFTRDSL